MAWRTMWKALRAGPLTEPAPGADPLLAESLAARLHAAAQRRLGRGLAIRQVDSGSCNGCELEIHMQQTGGLCFTRQHRHPAFPVMADPQPENCNTLFFTIKLNMLYNGW